MIFFELFYVFFLIGLFTFGGGYAMIPMITSEVVGRGWVDANVLTDFIAVSEATPGPFAINIATFIGSQTAGIFGSICATIGVILPSLIIILLIAFTLSKFMKNRYVKGALNKVQPIVIALITYTAISLLVNTIFFNKQIFNINSLSFDIKSIVLLIVISSFMFIYKKVNKKALSPIYLLLLSGFLGALLFSV